MESINQTITDAQQFRDELISDAIETCAVKGLMVKTVGQKDQVGFNHAPISLFPTPFPAKHYHQAKANQRALSFMVNDLTRKPSKIHELLHYFKENDLLMQKMLQISESYLKRGKLGHPRQDIHYLILRSDYMVDKDTDSLKMVEYNTVASSFGCLCQKTAEVQYYLLDKYRDRLQFQYKEEESKSFVQDQDQDSQLTQITSLAKTFQRAVQDYLQDMKQKFGNDYQHKKEQDLWVLFVIDKLERNICDQKWIEEELYNLTKIRSMRMTFEEIGRLSNVNQFTNALTINGNEIAFVYYRTGYQLEQYETEKDWETREMLELAQPIKCPSIDVQLTTFKKFQQAFSNESILKDIMSDHIEEAESIKHIFKGIWTLEDIDKENEEGKEVQEIIQKAIQNPHQFVIKPQKEGGGNNYYDEEVKNMLLENNKEYLKQFLIMERINPPEIKAYMLRNGALIESQTLSELGVYSSVVIRTGTDQRQIEDSDINTYGRLLRTKGKDSNEGGVNAGFAVIDSPLLVNVEDIKNDTILPSIDFF